MTQEQVKPRRRRPRRHRRQTRPRELPDIFFCGDPHGGFDQINEVARLFKPDAMVILGDLQPPAPLHKVLEEALAYTDIWWIPGNHDTDTDEIYDYLWRSELAGHNLHGRVANVAGLRIGGLGGVFRGQVWMPDGNPNYYSPATFMRRVGANNIWRGGVPRRHRSTIFPSVYGNLLRQKADILVTHEAPSCHKKGFCAIDRLAKSLNAKWLFHGHQHEDREYGMPSNILMRAVGYRGIVNLQGEVVIEAQLDPREEAALRSMTNWDERRLTDILIRDEDGRISFVPPREGLVRAILPAVLKVPAVTTAKPEPQQGRNGGKPQEKVRQERPRTTDLSREAFKRAQNAKPRQGRDRRRRPRRFGSQGS